MFFFDSSKSANLIRQKSQINSAKSAEKLEVFVVFFFAESDGFLAFYFLPIVKIEYEQKVTRLFLVFCRLNSIELYQINQWEINDF